MPKFSPEALLSVLKQLPSSQHYYIAYSAGLDSTVLVHALHRLGYDFELIHVHHHLQPEAEQWAEAARQLSQSLSRPLHLIHVQIENKPRHSLEAQARQARYQAMAQVMAPQSILFTAHHGDDQVETFLLQWLRGAGIAGLAAMPLVKAWQGGYLARPLLAWSKNELRAWAEAQGLSWYEDPSNQQVDFRRNWLRHQIIPQLQQYYPSLMRTNLRTTAHCAEAQSLLNELAAIDLDRVKHNDWQLNITALSALSRARQKNMLRYWLRRAPPSEAVLDQIMQQMQAPAQQQPQVRYGDWQIRRYRQRLYLMPEPLPQPEGRLFWHTEQPLKLPANMGQLVWQAERPAELLVSFGSPQCLKTKKFYQSYGIPPWLRPHLPLIHRQGQLWSIADYRLCAKKQKPPLIWQAPPWLR